MSRPVAAIDVGSNSVQLTMARVEGDRVLIIDRLKNPARLGDAVGPDGRLDPVAPDAALWADLRALLDRARGFGADPDPRAYAELIMDVFLALLRLTANEPLREICERLYFRTTRIWLKSVFAGRLDLASEVDVFRREVEDIVMALQVGDLHSAALIQRAHISMSFERMRRGLSG